MEGTPKDPGQGVPLPTEGFASPVMGAASSSHCFYDPIKHRGGGEDLSALTVRSGDFDKAWETD